MTRTMKEPDILAVALQVIDALDSLNVPYVVGGSMASIVHGTVRSTMDVDVVTDLKPDQVEQFLSLLKDDFYFDESAARQAVMAQSNFNLIHLDTMFKVDLFIPKARVFDSQQLARRVGLKLVPDSESTIWVLSAEDTILIKLEWFMLGGETSERQWLDILGVIRNQGSSLDLGYLRETAQLLNVADLLKRAFDDVGAS
jgi:hypothetical protein